MADGTPPTQRQTPPRELVQQSYLSAVSQWTVRGVRAALDAHEGGDFATSALLADAVMRDGQVFSNLSTRVSALSARSGLPFTVEPSIGVDDRRARSVAKRVSELWWTSIPEAEVAAMHRDAILLGVAVGRVEWTLTATEWLPRLRRMRPYGLRWNEERSIYTYQTSDGQTLDVTPGENGWVLHAPFGGDSWMMGAIRAVGLAWLMRTWAARDYARFSEKHGLPVLAIEEPDFASDDVEGVTGSAGSQVGEFYKQIRNMRSETVLRLPQPRDMNERGWSAKWLELVSTSTPFKDLMDLMRREIISVILGRDPETTSQNVGGDGASMLAKVEIEKLASDTEGMATTLREQVWKPYVVYNIDASRPELAPWPHWNTRPPADLSTRASTLKTAGEAIAALELLGVDTTPFLEELQLKTRDGGVPLKPPPEPAPADDTPTTEAA